MLFHAEIRHPILQANGEVYYGTLEGDSSDYSDRLRFEANSRREAWKTLRKKLEEEVRSCKDKHGIVHRPKVIGLCAMENVFVPAGWLAAPELRRYWLRPAQALTALTKSAREIAMSKSRAAD
jgi:hypothetical protein